MAVHVDLVFLRVLCVLRVNAFAFLGGEALQRPLELRLERGIELTVDQHVEHAHRLAGAVAPGVVGAALDDDVAGGELNLALVQHKIDFAVEHDRIVHGLGAVHQWMAAAADRKSTRLNSSHH